MAHALTTAIAARAGIAVPALVAILLCPGTGGAGDTPWTVRAPLAAPRQEVGTAAVAGRIYVVGGFRGDGSTADDVAVYDPATDAWVPVAPLPTPLHHPAAASVAGKLYVIGGLTGSSFRPVASVFAYDPGTDRWSEKAPMPTARGALAAAVIEGVVYVAGGSPAARERDFAAYDPAADRWTTLPDLPTARNHLAAGALGGRFYAAGGRSGSIGGITPALEAFDPATGAWTARAPLPTARGGIAAAVVRDRLLVFGGEGNPAHPSGVFAQVEAYDPTTDTWATLTPMRTPRHGIGAAVVADLVYVPGGATLQGFGASDVNEVFDAAAEPILSRCEDADPGEACDDGDPCTTADTCMAGRCTGTQRTCLDGALCRFERTLAGEECPRRLVRKVRTRAARAARKLEQAAGARGARAQRLLRRALRKLDAALRIVDRAARKGPIADGCTHPLASDLAERRAGIEDAAASQCIPP